MPVRFTPQNDADGTDEVPHDFRVGVLHSLIIEQPPSPALRRFYSWNSPGEIEIFGGLRGRPFTVSCWINSAEFINYADIYRYLNSVDLLTGRHGLFRLTTERSVTLDSDLNTVVSETVIDLANVTFMGLTRLPFNGQENAEPLRAIGTHGLNYGNWHMNAVLNFFQLDIVAPAAPQEGGN